MNHKKNKKTSMAVNPTRKAKTILNTEWLMSDDVCHMASHLSQCPLARGTLWVESCWTHIHPRAAYKPQEQSNKKIQACSCPYTIVWDDIVHAYEFVCAYESPDLVHAYELVAKGLIGTEDNHAAYFRIDCCTYKNIMECCGERPS